MDTVRSLKRQGTMSPKTPTNAPIELQTTPQTPPSQTPTPTSLYPAPLFSLLSRLPIPTTSSSTSTNPSPPVENNLQEIQEREEYLITQYTSVLDVLEAKYLEIGNRFMGAQLGSFEEKVLKGVMESLRQGMRENERCLERERRELWADFEPEEEEGKEQGSEVEGKGDGDGGVEVVTEGIERVGWPKDERE